MRDPNLPLGLLLLTACAGAQPVTVHLSAEGVALLEGDEEPWVELNDGLVQPNRLLIHEGQTLMTAPVLVLDGVELRGELAERDEVAAEWAGLSAYALGLDQVWGLRWTDWKNSDAVDHRVEVLRLEGQSWISEGDHVQRKGSLISRPGAAPLLFDPASGEIRTLDGALFQQGEPGDSWEMVVADGVVFQVREWEDTSVPGGAEARQQRVLGPDCEVLLAGQIAAAIATPEGLETLSVVSNVLHHERVSADCSVETLEEIYHPERGFSQYGGLRAGEEAWAYWQGSAW